MASIGFPPEAAACGRQLHGLVRQRLWWDAERSCLTPLPLANTKETPRADPGWALAGPQLVTGHAEHVWSRSWSDSLPRLAGRSVALGRSNGVLFPVTP